MAVSLTLFTALGVLWVVGAAPSIHWLDSSELACAACTLGISHPPGQIPHAILGGLLSILPLGDCAFRVTLLSVGASWAALSAAWIWLGKAVDESHRQSWTVAVLLSGSALSGLISTQAVRGEVYGLSAALTLAAIALCHCRGDARFRGLAWLAWGLSALNHPVISLAALPFLAGRGCVQWLGFGILPALGLLYLPLRAAAKAAWNFGNPMDGE
ncbi:MAG: DUF2723 domain-containing protein, partial [Pseudomonadota bacterium]